MNALARAEALQKVLADPNGLSNWPVGEAVLACAKELVRAGEPGIAAQLISSSETATFDRPVDWELRVRILRGDILYGQNRFELALTLHREVLRDPRCQSLSLDELCSVRIAEARDLWHLNRVDEAIEKLASVRQELLARPDSSTLAWCVYQMSSAHLMRGDSSQARRYALESIVSARRCQDRQLEALALGNLGRIEKQVCRWSSALEAQRENLAICIDNQDKRSEIIARQSIAIIEWKRGRLSSALENAETCLRESRAIGLDTWHWFAALLKGMTLLHQGSYDAARRLFMAGESWDVPVSNSRPSLLTSEFLGDVHLEQGEALEALRLYDEVFPKAMALVPKGDIVAELRRRRAECYLLLGRAEEAYTEALTGLEHCRELGDRYEEAATYRVLALAAAALGNAREARQLFEQGFSFYEDIETPFEWGKLWMSYGDWLSGPHAGESRDLRGALEAYVVAREHFERMGARAKLAMVNAKFQGVSAEVAASEAASAAPRIAEAPARTRATRRTPARSRADRELDERAAWALESFGIITRHRPLLHLLSQVEKLSKSRSPILILGESGTGKELVAKAVHRLSGREAAYLPVNCGAIPRELMESELFGHMSGAFTGAHRDKPGLFEVCDRGTVFLDEIGEMSLDLQSKLLRFLETGETRRVGATRNILADVRIVAATNRERAALEKGQGFRVDLYYRLAHAVVELPPLRARGHDAELLVDHFLASSCASARKRVQFSDDALDRLVHHSWPGNVRQLKGVIEHAVLIANDGDLVGPEHLQLAADRDVGSFEKEMEMVERRRIEEALRQHRGSKAEAARSLRMPRTTFLAKMKRYGML